MPSDTLDGPDVKRLERTSGVRVYHSPAIGLEYWVFNLAPHVTSRVHKSVIQSKAIRQGAGLGDRPPQARAGVAARLRRTRQYAALAQLRALHARPLRATRCSATTTTPPHARQILDAGGWKLGPDGIRRKNGVRASFELAYAGGTSEKRAVDADPRLGPRRRHRDRRARVRLRQAHRPRVQHRERQAQARFRHRAVVDRRRSDARVPALAVHEGPARRLERLGLGRRHLRAPVQAGDARHRRRRARRRHPPDAAHRRGPPALHRAVRARRPRRREHADLAALDDAALAGRPADHLLRLQHDHRAETGRARDARATPASPGRSPRWSRWRCSASASSFLAHRREQREPIEIADAPA